MYTALYRTFRPEVFDDILGQEHIVRILKNQLGTGTTSHAYLFCGTRGTGKTSTARILAKGLNCTVPGEKPCGHCKNCNSIKDGVFMDVIEIDAASNNGVDNIRELNESVKYPPVLGAYKVYIIDEVHMLSPGAFNALLKTLEEPPQNVVFILATTEPQKLPATILSRCLRLDFKRVPETLLTQGMRKICDTLEIGISQAALGLIAANADGSVRDGLSLLDQCIAAGDQSVSRETVLEILGTLGEEVFIEMTDFVLEKDVAQGLLLLDRVLADGKDVRQFLRDWIAHLRNLLMTKFIKNPEDMLNMSWENVERIREQSQLTELEFLNTGIVELSRTASEAKWSTQPRILLELAIVKLTTNFETQKKQSIQSHPVKSKDPSQRGNPLEEKEVAVEKVGKPKESTPRPELTKPVKSFSWADVFDQPEAQKASYNLLRSGSTLLGVEDGNLMVQANNEMILKILTENAKDIESIFKRLSGQEVRLVPQLAGQDSEETKQHEVEELAHAIGDRLGLNIEIE
ncbi:MAG: DNA polymerase III subunit gamma/tau [Anaerovorax sp.]